MFFYTFKQYAYHIISASALLLPVMMAAVFYWSKLETNSAKKWAVRSRANAWWLALIAGFCAFYVQVFSKPFSDDELRLQLAAARQIGYACSDWTEQYVLQYTQKPSHEVAGTRSWKTWELIDGLPDLSYSEENWRRMRPMVDERLDRFIAVTQDALNSFPVLLPLELRTKIVLARSQFEFDKSNYYMNYDSLESQEKKDGFFSNFVRGPIPEVKMVCDEAGQVIGRWRLTRINTPISTFLDAN